MEKIYSTAIFQSKLQLSCVSTITQKSKIFKAFFVFARSKKISSNFMFLQFALAVQQIGNINLMPLNNKVYGIQDEEQFKRGSHRIQELFFSTRSGAVYLKYSKDQKLLVWMDRRIKDTRQRNINGYEAKKPINKQKTPDNKQKAKSIVSEKWEMNSFPVKKNVRWFLGFSFLRQILHRNMYRQTYFFSFCNLYLERWQKYFFEKEILL